MFYSPLKDTQSELRHSKDLHDPHKWYRNHSWARYRRWHKHHGRISVPKLTNTKTGNSTSRIQNKVEGTQPWPSNHGRMHRHNWKQNQRNRSNSCCDTRKDWLFTFTRKTKPRRTWQLKIDETGGLKEPNKAVKKIENEHLDVKKILRRYPNLFQGVCKTIRDGQEIQIHLPIIPIDSSSDHLVLTNRRATEAQEP